MIQCNVTQPINHVQCIEINCVNLVFMSTIWNNFIRKHVLKDLQGFASLNVILFIYMFFLNLFFLHVDIGLDIFYISFILSNLQTARIWG